jgi:hypothetical protein
LILVQLLGDDENEMEEDTAKVEVIVGPKTRKSRDTSAGGSANPLQITLPQRHRQDGRHS